MRTRHRRSSRRLDRLSVLADRLWRVPLSIAVAVFAICGPAHALGHTDFVFYAVLVGLVLSAFAVPMGLLGLRHSRDTADEKECRVPSPVPR